MTRRACHATRGHRRSDLEGKTTKFDPATSVAGEMVGQNYTTETKVRVNGLVVGVYRQLGEECPFHLHGHFDLNGPEKDG